MRISNLKFIHDGNRARVTANVQWEDCDRPGHNIYIETEEAFAKDLSLSPHAFLVGCIIPALHFGERRIFLDAEICPTLREGLETVMALMKEWTKGEYKPLNTFRCTQLKQPQTGRTFFVRRNGFPGCFTDQQKNISGTASRIHKGLPSRPWF